MNEPAEHLLVVGGTGMLAEATRRLADGVPAVTLVARRPERLDDLSAEAVHRFAVDYHETDELLDRLEAAVVEYGEFTRALTWVHASAEASLRRVADRLDAQSNRPELVDVQGSAAGRPDRAESSRHRYLEGLDGIDYRRVILGFVRQEGRSRWLTDTEISDGVIEAVESGARRHVVGQIEPWEHRP